MAYDPYSTLSSISDLREAYLQETVSLSDVLAMADDDLDSEAE